MSKKITLIVLLGILIITMFGFFYYKTSAIDIDTPNLPSQGQKMLAFPLNDEEPFASNISLYLIGQANEKVSEVGLKLNEAKKKDLSEFDLLHRKFLENMIELVEDNLDESKKQLILAEGFFEEGEYFKASDRASLSAGIATMLPRHTNNILEGRTKEDWNRLDAIETNE